MTWRHGAKAVKARRWFCASALLLAGHVAAGTVFVGGGARLEGTGSVAGDVIVQSGGTISGGNSASTVGCMQVSSLQLEAGSLLETTIGGTVPCSQHDLVSVTGNLSAEISDVAVNVILGYTPVIADEIVLVSIGGAPASPTSFMHGVSQETISVSGVPLSIEVNGGDGNDVSLRYRLRPSDPVILAAFTSDEGEITVEFSVENVGSDALTDLNVQCSGSGSTQSGTVTGNTAIVGGLNPDATYTCTVTAANADGESSSAPSLALVPAYVPTGIPIWLLYEASKR